ncbi:MAG: carbon storage regulator CsrA [Candidatus Cohnella colombiensis]|uniref:Translational regulator CsrA n=1 Tax=Candidatus Cohnella colombiensis TaxID=3121368 RepID=A0AA95F367_9BACL|nr:MAG: carbon storage regulator CsrA [Cohnella sp.]
MLVLSRKKGQSIIIQDHIEITVLEVDGDTIKIGIVAPKEVQVMRKELLISIQQSNQEAAKLYGDIANLSSKLKKIEKNSVKPIN